jgi:hypothetical protein
MGLEAQCEVKSGKQVSRGKAQLETETLLFRGDFRLDIPLKAITAVEARGGKLVVKYPGGTAAFALGPQAEKWYLKIRYPRGLLEKLGVKPGMRVALLGTFPSDFGKQIRERTEMAATNLDVVFLLAETAAALKQLASLQKKIPPAGSIWVIYRKGQKEFGERDVMAGGKAAKLVDVKVVSFTETHTGLKFVIPKARR